MVLCMIFLKCFSWFCAPLAALLPRAPGSLVTPPRARNEVPSYHRGFEAPTIKALVEGDPQGLVMDWTRGDFSALNLVGLQAPGADFSHSIFSDTHLTGAVLTEANLSHTHWQGTNAWGAHLRGASFRGARLENSVLSAAELQGSSWEDAELSNVFLLGASLEGADFSRARFKNVYIYELPQNPTFPREGLLIVSPNHRRCHPLGPQWGETRKRHPLSPFGYDLCQFEEGANFSGYSEAIAGFWKAHLSYANFRGAQLPGAHFKEADLRGASFQGADLRGANFTGANLSGADFRGALLDGAILSLATCTGAMGLPNGHSP